jgi:hypothetical protein
MGNERKYIDFKLYLTKAAGDEHSYQVSLLPTPEVGESSSPIPFSTSEGAYAENVSDIRNRQINTSYLFDVGKQLADWLLPKKGGGRELFARALTLVGNKGGVRLRLIIADPSLKQVPWEYVYNPLVTTDTADGFLALDPRISIVRHEPLMLPHREPIELEPGQTDLRMFAASASPVNATQIAVAEEMDKLQSELESEDTRAIGRPRVKIKPKFSKATAWEEVTKEVDRPGKYHIFHFAGHGVRREEENNLTLADIDLGQLLMSGRNNKGEFITAGTFAKQMQAADMWLVTLGACETGEQSTSHPEHGIAGALLAANIPVVIAMQNEIGDKAATEFSLGFYEKLASGLTLDEAMSWSRRKMAGSMLSQNDEKGNMEWGIPVLYTRLADGVLVPEVVKQGSQAAEEIRLEIQKEINNIMTDNSQGKIEGDSISGTQVTGSAGGDIVTGTKIVDNSQGKVGGDNISGGQVGGNVGGDFVSGSKTVDNSQGRVGGDNNSGVQIGTLTGSYVAGNQTVSGSGNVFGTTTTVNNFQQAGSDNQDELADRFKRLRQKVQTDVLDGDDRGDAQAEVDKLEIEIKKGQSANDREMRNSVTLLKSLAPSVLQLIAALIKDVAKSGAETEKTQRTLDIR